MTAVTLMLTVQQTSSDRELVHIKQSLQKLNKGIQVGKGTQPWNYYNQTGSGFCLFSTKRIQSLKQQHAGQWSMVSIIVVLFKICRRI